MAAGFTQIKVLLIFTAKKLTILPQSKIPQIETSSDEDSSEAGRCMYLT